MALNQHNHHPFLISGTCINGQTFDIIIEPDGSVYVFFRSIFRQFFTCSQKDYAYILNNFPKMHDFNLSKVDCDNVKLLSSLEMLPPDHGSIISYGISFDQFPINKLMEQFEDTSDNNYVQQ